jgi:hypothetical protein
MTRSCSGLSPPRANWTHTAHDLVVAGQGLCGRDRIRTCVGNAGDFTGRTAVSWRVPSRPRLFPITARDVHKRPANSLRRHSASLPVSPQPARPGVGRREVGGNPGCQLTKEFRAYFLPAFVSLMLGRPSDITAEWTARGWRSWALCDSAATAS